VGEECGGKVTGGGEKQSHRKCESVSEPFIFPLDSATISIWLV
jgi:hypothetical protein